MPRGLRNDTEGTYFHVMNRGGSKRPVFNTREDMRAFLASVACAVRRGDFELHAYSLMRTHFHMFVRSLGNLSYGMQLIQQAYTRRFNTLNRRDSSLMRSRFFSVPVLTISHARNTVFYIHENPVAAKIVEAPADYPWSSAHHVSHARLPPWLHSHSIERFGISKRDVLKLPDPEVLEARAEFVDGRLARRGLDDPFLLDEITAGHVVAWLKQRAELADGCAPTSPVVGGHSLIHSIMRRHGGASEGMTRIPGKRPQATHRLLLAGLLKHAAGWSMQRIAVHLGVSTRTARRLARDHRQCIQHLPGYVEHARQVLEEALRLLHPVLRAETSG